MDFEIFENNNEFFRNYGSLGIFLSIFEQCDELRTIGNNITLSFVINNQFVFENIF